MKNSESGRKKRERRGDCSSRESQTSTSAASTAKTGYAAVWLDDYDYDFGVYKVFRERGEALDYITGMVFERAEHLGVPVTASDESPVLENGEWRFPVLTKEQVRDRIASGLDFHLALRVVGSLDRCNPLYVTEQITLGIREVEVE